MEIADSNENPLETAIRWADEGRRVAMATVIATWGSSSRPTGSQLVVDSAGAFEGSVTGGCVEPAVITEAFDVIKTGGFRRLVFGVTDEEAWEVGMTCGGRIEVLVESFDARRAMAEKMVAAGKALLPACMITDLKTGGALFFNPADAKTGEDLPAGLETAAREAIARGICAIVHEGALEYYIHGIYPRPRLVVIGAVDIARVLARMALLADYSVVVIDPRGAFATKARFPDVEILVEWPDEALAAMTIAPRTAVVALTHDPKIDDPALGAALRSPAFYIGVLGSRKTHAARLERLGGAGFSAEELARLHGPVGLGIGAKTPGEIKRLESKL